MATSYTHDMARVVTGEAARLKEFLTSMTPADWDADSACQGWIVEDVVAHLAGSAGNWAASIQRALDGYAGQPPGGSFLAPGERASHPFGPEVRQSRQLTRDELLANFISGHQHLANILAGVKEDDWEKPCFHRRGPLPMRQYLGVQLQELTLHGWDIRSGLNPAAELSEEPMEQMIGMVPRWLRTAFMPNQDLPTPARYRFDVSSPVPVHQDILVTGAQYQATASTSERADATIRGSTGNYLLLMFGRLQLADAAVSGRLTVDGSLDQAKNFNTWFPGF